jgi:hypothetical protein
MSNDATKARTLADRLSRCSFFQVLMERRSRRFGLGMSIPAGPLAYQSRHRPAPLTEEEEAALAFAACGITGYALADLCYSSGHGGNIMAGHVGRTIASGDALHTVALVITNDQATYLLKRPRDFAAEALPEIVELGRSGALLEWYRRSRVLLKPGRAAPPLEPLFNLDVNRWSLYTPGSTYFLPINDLTFMYINGLLDIFGETTGVFVLDERAGFRPAGLARFARSRGGHLENDLRRGRVATIRLVEQLVTEFVTIEQGMMLQNLGLMAQALGLGGFANFANHEFGWFQALGFDMREMPASAYLGAGRLTTWGMNLLKRNPPVPIPSGLAADGTTWLKPFCPPHYSSMTAAVQAVVQAKFGPSGIKPPMGTSWRDPAAVTGQIPLVSDAAIAATAAYCEYVWNRYGRFPAYPAPYRTVLGFQASHLDAEFYDRFYRPEAMGETQQADFARRQRNLPTA